MPTFDSTIGTMPPALSNAEAFSEAFYNYDGFDIEPDERWKGELKERIKESLQSMIKDARVIWTIKRQQTSISDVDRERYKVEYSQTVKMIHELATESYYGELERERQVRRRAIGMHTHTGWDDAATTEPPPAQWIPSHKWTYPQSASRLMGDSSPYPPESFPVGNAAGPSPFFTFARQNSASGLSLVNTISERNKTRQKARVPLQEEGNKPRDTGDEDQPRSTTSSKTNQKRRQEDQKRRRQEGEASSANARQSTSSRASFVSSTTYFGDTPGISISLPTGEQRRHEEGQNQKRLEQFRREQERMEAERLARIKELSPKEVVQLVEHHFRIWSRLNNLENLRWMDFPWPMFRRPSSPKEITIPSISTYIHSNHHPYNDKSAKERVILYLRKWHHDRFETNLLPKVVEEDKEIVKEGRGMVARYLIELLTKAKHHDKPNESSSSRSSPMPEAPLNSPDQPYCSSDSDQTSEGESDSEHTEDINQYGANQQILNACDVLKTICSDRAKYKKALNIHGSAAQLVLDVMETVLEYAIMVCLDSKFENNLLKAMLRLSRRTTLCPRMYLLSAIEREAYPTASGQFGEVFPGTYNGRRVSLKVCKLYSRQMFKINGLLKSFYREAIIWRHLTHPNLLPFYGIYQLGDSGGRICLVSPWMNNGNIVEYLRKYPHVNRQHLILDISRGISYLHDKSIVHGDLKGANVLISDSGIACLADFGLSAVVNSNSHTLAWTSFETCACNGGTVRWQAPELFAMDSEEPSSGVTKEGDIYAFACVCYEILVGKEPFHQFKKDATVIYKVMTGQRPSRPDEFATHWGLTDWTWAFIEECWNQYPAERPKISEVVERLSLRKEFSRHINGYENRVAGHADWGDLRPEVFRQYLREEQSSVSDEDIRQFITLIENM